MAASLIRRLCAALQHPVARAPSRCLETGVRPSERLARDGLCSVLGGHLMLIPVACSQVCASTGPWTEAKDAVMLLCAHLASHGCADPARKPAVDKVTAIVNKQITRICKVLGTWRADVWFHRELFQYQSGGPRRARAHAPLDPTLMVPSTPRFHADLPISGAEESRMRKNGDWARLAALTAMPPPNLILRQDADAFLYVNGRRLGREKAPKQPGQLPETD